MIANAAAADLPGPPVPVPLRRVLTVVAGVGLLAGLTDDWIAAAETSTVATLVITAGFLAVVVVAILALAAREERTLDRLDAVLLVVGLGVLLARFRGVFHAGFDYPTDEGRLGGLATEAVIHGHDPYAMSWPSIALHPGATPLMSGGVVTKFAYPPVSLLVGAFLHLLHGSLATPAAATGLALMVTGVLCFVLLPRGIRVLSVLVVLGLGLLAPLAINGHLVFVALPFACVAAYRWTGIGAGGRLGRGGIGRALCLGLAAATQQLLWFPAVLLLLAVWLVRRGELSDRAAAAVLARFVAVGVVAFAVPNVPFVVADPHAWLSAMLSVFTQHAVVYGQGLVALSTVVVGHSGGLAFYSYATVLLGIAFLAISTVGFRAVARALPVLPAALFVVSSRSESDYFVVLIPLWLVWAVTADTAAIEAARPLLASLTARWLSTPVRRVGAAIGALVPALACVAVAVATPSPLDVRVTAAELTGARLTGLTIVVHNDSGRAIRSSFLVNTRSRIRSPWHVLGRPRVPAHATRTLRLAPNPTSTLSTGAPDWVFVTSGTPLAFTSARIRVRPQDITVVGPIQQSRTNCMRRLLTGRTGSCGPAD